VELHFDLSDAYRLLTASTRLEKSKELDEFQASFLTYQIHQTLTQPPSEICADNSIRESAFYQWLVKVAKQHNRHYADLILRTRLAYLVLKERSPIGLRYVGA
jgi:hypothetical protein